MKEKELEELFAVMQDDVGNSHVLSDSYLQKIKDIYKTGSDGFHTMEELYEHRNILYIAFVKFYHLHVSDFTLETGVWRSKLHDDGTMYPDYFILGITDVNGKQITYHLPLSYWEDTDFAETLEKAPKFDGHTSNDVLKRIKKL